MNKVIKILGMFLFFLFVPGSLAFAAVVSVRKVLTAPKINTTNEADCLPCPDKKALKFLRDLKLFIERKQDNEKQPAVQTLS